MSFTGVGFPYPLVLEINMGQEEAVFASNTRYIRVLSNGWVYPDHEETAKMVRKGTAEFVVRNGDEWDLWVDASAAPEAPPKKISTPMRRPAPIPAAQPKKAAVDLSNLTGE
jgi:hypothetical protein